MSLSLVGKTAIVTGASRGIGFAIARHFLSKGANVMAVDCDEAQLTAAFGDMTQNHGDDDKIRLFAGNLCQKLTISNLLLATVDAFDHIDVLINANRRWAVSDPLNPEDAAVETLWTENVLTTLRLSQMTARRMIAAAEKNDIEGDAGTIVNLSSLAAHRCHADLLAYSMAAAGVEQMTKSLALALAPKRVRVNALAVASVLSDSLQNSLKTEENWRDEMVAATPLGRIAPPDELVEAVQFLASDASSFMTGQVMCIDGGRSLSDVTHVPGY